MWVTIGFGFVSNASYSLNQQPLRTTVVQLQMSKDSVEIERNLYGQKGQVFYADKDGSINSLSSNSVNHTNTNQDEKKGIGRIGGIFNLLNTAVGGGLSIMAIPVGIRYLGIYLFIFFQILFAILTAVSLYTLVDLGDQTNLLSLDELVPTVHRFDLLSKCRSLFHSSSNSNNDSKGDNSNSNSNRSSDNNRINNGKYGTTRCDPNYEKLEALGKHDSVPRIYVSNMPSEKQTNIDRLWYYKLFSKLISFIISFNCLAIIIAFLDTIDDVMNAMVDAYSISDKIHIFCVVILIIILYFLCLLDNVRQIQYLSSIAMGLCVVFLIILFINFIVLYHDNRLPDSGSRSYNNDHFSTTDFLKGIPALLMSWGCQFMVLPVLDSLEPQKDRRKHSIHVIGGMVASTFILYTFEGIVAYFSFEYIESDITKNINPDNNDGNANIGINNNIARIGMISLAIAVYLTVPLFFVEMRHRFFHLINLGEHLTRVFLSYKFLLFHWVFSKLGLFFVLYDV